MTLWRYELWRHNFDVTRLADSIILWITFLFHHICGVWTFVDLFGLAISQLCCYHEAHKVNIVGGTERSHEEGDLSSHGDNLPFVLLTLIKLLITSATRFAQLIDILLLKSTKQRHIYWPWPISIKIKQLKQSLCRNVSWLTNKLSEQFQTIAGQNLSSICFRCSQWNERADLRSQKVSMLGSHLLHNAGVTRKYFSRADFPSPSLYVASECA